MMENHWFLSEIICSRPQCLVYGTLVETAKSQSACIRVTRGKIFPRRPFERGCSRKRYTYLVSNDTLNSLARASSSFLRSAMHQPIHWHEWGLEPFEKAKQENKPILLDSGAVWCHWCHVMDRESYEDPQIATLINEHFIAIKIDRDERPDVDSRYQSAVQAISGQGGWPLTAFLTPEGKPFYAGTYFPPRDYQGRPSFRRVLLTLAQAFQERHGEVLESAESVMDAISRAEGFTGKSGSLQAELIESMVESVVKLY